LKQKVIVTCGLPASGKSTFAKEWVAKDPTNRVRINKDDLRMTLHGGKYSKGNESQVIRIEEQILIDSLVKGKSIIVDNTHLATRKDGKNKHFERIRQTVENNSELCGLSISTELKRFEVEPEECIKRDLQRTNSVGPDVIWRMYWDHIAEVENYKFVHEKQDAIIVDVDGTLAQMEGRHPFEWDKVGTDSVRKHIRTLVNVYACNNFKIIVLTGRNSEAYNETEMWLIHNGIGYDKLFSRATGDYRKDFVVKRELYKQHIEPYYNVHLVVDDRPQVIREWRRLGLPVINANPCDREF